MRRLLTPFHAPGLYLRAGLRPVLLGCLLLLSTWTLGQVSRESDVKAVFLFNFLQFVEWPSTSFQAADSAYVIGILGADPFGSAIDDIVQHETIKGRKVVVQRYRRVEDIAPCHILYICESEESRLPRILALLQHRPILTVSDIDGFTGQGGIIRFYRQTSKVRLRINNEVARMAGLSVSTKLLRIADVVSTNSLR